VLIIAIGFAIRLKIKSGRGYRKLLPLD